MNQLECEYKVTVQDFRQAYHYGVLSRNQIGFRMFAIVAVAMILYGFLVVSTLLPLNYVALFVGGAELLWAMWIFADAERKIFQYIRSADSSDVTHTNPLPVRCLRSVDFYLIL